MATLEKVDRLRTRTGVSYDEAREALDSSDGDILDALIWLENNGKIDPPRVSRYTTDADGDAGSDDFNDMPYGRTDRYYDVNDKQAERKKRKNQSGAQGGGKNTGQANRAYEKGHGGHHREDARDKRGYYYDDSERRAKNSAFFKSAVGFIGKAFHIGNSTLFEISRSEQDVIKLPLTVLVIIFIFFMQVTLVLLPLGLFFGFRYKLSGNMFNEGPVNKVLKTVADAVDGIKDAFRKNKRG